MSYYKIFPIIIIIVVLGYFSIYIVDEREQVVITQFGKVIGEPITEAGLKIKWFFQIASYFPKNLQQWDGTPGQIPTSDKTYIWVDAFARWKIVDAVKYFRTVKDKSSAIGRLDDIIDAAVRNLITSYPLIETVRKSNRQLDTVEVGLEDLKKDQQVFNVTIGREKITQIILDQAQPKLGQFGIQIVDVKIKRINYVEEVRKTVYDRMIAERKQIAEKYRSEGKGHANKIMGEKERDLKQIISEAYKEAQKTMGEADAEAAHIYAEAYSIDPEFYSFTRTLEAYKESLDGKSSLILSTDSEFLKYFKGYK